MWGSKGYAKEIPPVAIATPPPVVVAPHQVEPAVDGERERETEREREREEDLGEREETTSSHPLTAVSVQYHSRKISPNCYYRYMYCTCRYLKLHATTCVCTCTIQVYT